MNAAIVNPRNNPFTINELHKGCSQRLYLCSFLSFWVGHGDGKQAEVGGRISYIVQRLPEILEDGENSLPGNFHQLVDWLGAHLKALDRQVDELKAQIQQHFNGT